MSEDQEFQCNHTGKFIGVGQSTLMLGSNLLVIVSSICQECGQTSVTIKKISLAESKILTPKANIPGIIK